MVLRNRKKQLEKAVTDLDAFPKVELTYVERTASGASVSIITFICVVLLLHSEITYYFWPSYKFRFISDADLHSKLKLNVDLTVAMPCDLIGADILDKTDQNAFTFGRLRDEPTWFELEEHQQTFFTEMGRLNAYLREEYHQLQDILWKSGFQRLYGEMPGRRTKPDVPHDACRIHGTLTLNKVAGNFHVTAGKVLPIPGAHAHLASFLGDHEYNFTHRIEKFTFGDSVAGIIQPLEGEEKITNINMMTFHYFIDIVPTEVEKVIGKRITYQYSVKELARPISHGEGSHGTPGIYFKYDISAMKVSVTSDREGFWMWLVGLCAGVGGICATSNILAIIIKWIVNTVCCAMDANKESGGSTSVPSKASLNLVKNNPIAS